MSLGDDLLPLARKLSRAEENDQASLRRAVSTSYYALFHFLVDEATKRMFGPADEQAALRACLARAFDHRAMRQVAEQFATRLSGERVSGKLRPGLNGQPLQPELARIADAFVKLHTARHHADYNTARTFHRSDVLDLMRRVERAFKDWEKIRGSIQADVFLAGLLAFRNIRA